MGKQVRKPRTVLQIARKYVDQQLATMRKHGAVLRLSAKEYNALVHQVVEATAK